MHVFITKHALTNGIEEANGEVLRLSPPELVLENGVCIYGANNWHTDRKSAVKRAEDMRVKKIASLKEQLAKLKVLRFY